MAHRSPGTSLETRSANSFIQQQLHPLGSPHRYTCVSPKHECRQKRLGIDPLEREQLLEGRWLPPWPVSTLAAPLPVLVQQLLRSPGRESPWTRSPQPWSPDSGCPPSRAVAGSPLAPRVSRDIPYRRQFPIILYIAGLGSPSHHFEVRLQSGGLLRNCT